MVLCLRLCSTMCSRVAIQLLKRCSVSCAAGEARSHASGNIQSCSLPLWCSCCIVRVLYIRAILMHNGSSPEGHPGRCGRAWPTRCQIRRADQPAAHEHRRSSLTHGAEALSNLMYCESSYCRAGILGSSKGSCMSHGTQLSATLACQSVVHA